MADEARPMSTLEVRQGLGSLLATMRGGDPPPSEEGAAPEEGPEEGQDDAVSLADQSEEEAEESGDAEQDEGEEEEQEETEFSLTYKYKGQDYQITDPAEAAKYVQLGKHLSERQDEIVTREKTAEEAFSEADQSRQRYAQSLSEVAQFFEQVVGEPPKESDFKDRTQFLEAVNQHNQAQAAVTTYRTELQRVQAEAAEAQMKKLEKWATDQENETLAAVPEWHDSAVRQAEVRAMQEYASQIGVPQEALSSPLLANAKWFRLALRDAYRYRKAAETGSAEVRKRQQTKDAAPGSGGEVRQEGRNRQRRAIEERMKSGKLDDIAPAAAQLLQRQRQLQRQAAKR